MVMKPASEMQVSVKNSVEGVRIFQVVESEANAGLALSKRIYMTGNQSIDPGRGAQVSPPLDHQGELEKSHQPQTKNNWQGGHWWTRAWAEAVEVSHSKMELPWLHKNVRHLTKEGKVGARGGRGSHGCGV